MATPIKKPKSKLQEAYSKFFKEKLKKYHVTSPSQIKDVNKKKQFFNEIKTDWQKRRRKIKDPEKLKSKYTNIYLSHVQQRFAIPRSKLESGMLIELRYHTINKRTGENNPNRKYFILILHPNWHKKMHALRLDFVSPRWTRKLAEDQGLIVCDTYPKTIKLNVKQINLIESESKKFYIKELKPNMIRKYNASYRTFNLNRIANCMLYNFSFTDF